MVVHRVDFFVMNFFPLKLRLEFDFESRQRTVFERMAVDKYSVFFEDLTDDCLEIDSPTV